MRKYGICSPVFRSIFLLLECVVSFMMSEEKPIPDPLVPAATIPATGHRSIKSFVIRGGRMTAGQQRAYDALWPVFGLTVAQGALNPLEVFGRAAPLVLEIGFGMGKSLAQMAEAAPDTDFIGIEVHRPGVGALLMEVQARGLRNLRIYSEDAIDVLDKCIPAASLDLLQLFFPDPWHKKKHHKRRMVQLPFAEKIRAHLKPGGVFHMATDWQNYAEQMLEVMSNAPGYENCAGAGAWSPRPDSRPLTKFEQRGERLGHGVWDLRFRVLEQELQQR
jgi:tRNA (guanine-N7-)-methyltransferase